MGQENPSLSSPALLQTKPSEASFCHTYGNQKIAVTSQNKHSLYQNHQLNLSLLGDSFGHSVLTSRDSNWAGMWLHWVCTNTWRMSNARNRELGLAGNKNKMKCGVVSVVAFHHSAFAQIWKNQNLVCEVLEGLYQESLCSQWAIFEMPILAVLSTLLLHRERTQNKQTKQNQTPQFKSSKSGKDTKWWNWKNQLKAASASHGKP